MKTQIQISSKMQLIFSLRQVAAFICILIPLRMVAQTGGGIIDTTDKVFKRRWEASLGELQKPVIPPPVPPANVPAETMKFEEKEFSATTSYTPPAPRVKKPEKPVWPALQNNFVKVGFGRFSTPFAKLYMNTGRNTSGDAGLDFSHLSSSNGQVDFAEFREDYGTLKGQYLLKSHSVGAKFHVYNTNYFYYADTIVEGQPDLKDSISMGFTRFQFDTWVKKNTSNVGVNYDVPLRFRYFSDKYQDRELHFSLMPSLNWNIAEHFDADLSTNLTFSNANIDSVTQSRFFLDLTPAVKMNFDRLNLTAALKVASFTDSVNLFRVMPILQAQYHLSPGKFSIKAGLRGDMINNQFTDLIGVNRYLARQNNIKPTIETFHLYAGIDGNFAKYFNYGVSVYNKNVENQALFYNTAEGAYFSILYDSAFKETGLEMNLDFSKEDKIKAGIKANVRKFNTSNDSLFYNFGIPATKLDIWGSYNFADKVWVTTEIYLYGNRVMSLDSALAPIEQNMQADINLHLEYRFSKRISLFLDLNNLLGNQYYRWHNYLERPFDIKGGVTASF
jgi:hypothetical protein